MKKIFAYIFILFSICSYSQEEKYPYSREEKYPYSREKMEEKIVRDEHGDKYMLYTDKTWKKVGAEIDPILQELQEKVVLDVLHLTGKRGKRTSFIVRVLKEKDAEDNETIRKVTTSTSKNFQEEVIQSIVEVPKDKIDESDSEDSEDKIDESDSEVKTEEIVTKKTVRESKDKRTFDLKITNNYSKDIKLLTYLIKFKHVDDYVIVDKLNIRDLKQGESRKIKETVTVGDIDGRDYDFDLINYELEEK
jgi:hypothetical protein